MPEDRYLELNANIGVDLDGNPEPIREVGVAINVPTMKDGEVVDIAERITLTPIPGTRVIKTSDPLIAQALLDSGQYHETDAPSKADLAKQRKVTEDARANAGAHTPDPEEA